MFVRLNSTQFFLLLPFQSKFLRTRHGGELVPKMHPVHIVELY